MSRTQRILFWAGGLVVLGVVVHELRSILLPFVAGMAVAYALDPLADRLERAGCSRVLATAIITAGFFVGVIALIALLYPLLQAQVLSFVQQVPELLAMIQHAAQGAIERVRAAVPAETLDQLRSAAGDFSGTVFDWLKRLARGVWSGGVAIFEIASLIIITPIVSFYMLLEWDRIVEKVDSLLPREQAPVIREQMRLIDETVAGFMRGQATVCLVLGAYYGIALSLVGLDAGLLVGIGAGIVSFIPYVGALSGFIVGVGLALVQFDAWTPIVLVGAVFVAGQMAEGYVLTPRLVGGRVGLHDLWIIFALMAGGTLFGFVGVLLAIPTAAVIGVLIRFAVARYLESPLYHGGGEEDT